NDCLKAGVTPQRIPNGMQPDIAITNMTAWQLGRLSQSLNGSVFFTGPSVYHRKVLYQHRTLDGTLRNGYQLNRTLALANRILLVAQDGVDHSERAESL